MWGWNSSTMQTSGFVSDITYEKVAGIGGYQGATHLRNRKAYLVSDYLPDFWIRIAINAQLESGLASTY